jgi:hypothetical protein
MSKAAKTASKNNPSTREQAIEFFHNGKKIKPVKLVTQKSSFFAAEYDGSSTLVVDANGAPLPWGRAKNLK